MQIIVHRNKETILLLCEFISFCFFILADFASQLNLEHGPSHKKPPSVKALTGFLSPSMNQYLFYFILFYFCLKYNQQLQTYNCDIFLMQITMKEQVKVIEAE